MMENVSHLACLGLTLTFVNIKDGTDNEHLISFCSIRISIKDTSPFGASCFLWMFLSRCGSSIINLFVVNVPRLSPFARSSLIRLQNRRTPLCRSPLLLKPMREYIVCNHFAIKQSQKNQRSIDTSRATPVKRNNPMLIHFQKLPKTWQF